MSRYVVLEHRLDDGRVHWDFMLEADSVLWTWQVKEPVETWNGILTCCRLVDHRITYLGYEGPVSRNRGEVRQVDAGEYILIESGADRLTVRLDGQVLDGIVRLEQRDDNWVLIYTRGVG